MTENSKCYILYQNGEVIYMNMPLVLLQFLDRAVALYGEKDAVHCEERVLHTDN